MKLKKESPVLAEKLSSFPSDDQERILKAFELAQAHSDGTENFAGVAFILLDLGLDTDTIIAALIRLLPAKSALLAKPTLPESLSEQFGADVSLLVYGAKKIDSLKTNNRTVQEAQNIRNMLLVLADDIRIVFIKLAEKLHSMRILDSSLGEGRKTAARECLDIYAPLANRLGISWMKNEMEDLSLKFLNRETFQQIKEIVSEKLDQRNKFLDYAQRTIKTEAKTMGINVEVKSRAKHFYSVYMKMRKRNKTVDEIFDLAGMRIICDSVDNCYTLLGLVHRLGQPGNGTFRDYIARPKSNGYQSLHTTVMIGKDWDSGQEISEQSFGEEGKLLEIQIRTAEMHQIAEHGIASHWLYKKGSGSSHDLEAPEEIGIVNKLKSLNRNDEGTGESSSLLDGIKQEITRKSIYVFTPQGKVIKLPKGGTPIDFAYHIHTDIGERCVGAKANGHIIPLKSQLENTQVVEILTAVSAHPHFGWLEYVKSSKARSKIRWWLTKNDEFHSADKDKTGDAKKKAGHETHVTAPIPAKKAHTESMAHPPASVLKVRIEDEKNMMIRFARCCSPASGEQIIGYVSRGRGIIIHRVDCINLAHNPEVEHRKIVAEWDNVEPVPMYPPGKRAK
ncbi:MAG: HD domain-containing protein [Treponema sp.]|nr:HD domain-containing protein [Treponema sp.]